LFPLILDGLGSLYQKQGVVIPIPGVDGHHPETKTVLLLMKTGLLTFNGPLCNEIKDFAKILTLSPRSVQLGVAKIPLQRTDYIVINLL
jgi:hypothetical protein